MSHFQFTKQKSVTCGTRFNRRLLQFKHSPEDGTCTVIIYNILLKGMIMVGRELRQQHPSDLLSPPDNKSRWCWCRNTLPTVINSDYKMTKQLGFKRSFDKIRSKSPPNRANSPTCLQCDVTHLSLATGVVALHIPSWMVGVREERRQARKIVWTVNTGILICRYQNNLYGIINHHERIWDCFCRCKS